MWWVKRRLEQLLLECVHTDNVGTIWCTGIERDEVEGQVTIRTSEGRARRRVRPQLLTPTGRRTCTCVRVCVLRVLRACVLRVCVLRACVMRACVRAACVMRACVRAACACACVPTLTVSRWRHAPMP